MDIDSPRREEGLSPPPSSRGRRSRQRAHARQRSRSGPEALGSRDAEQLGSAARGPSKQQRGRRSSEEVCSYCDEGLDGEALQQCEGCVSKLHRCCMSGLVPSGVSVPASLYSVCVRQFLPRSI